ncbi:MAG: hypothetical protein ACE5KC_04115 [Candidatus Bathyarchaeia archaeon]
MRRWVTLTGRIGTVLLMVGLALALVSLIPPATMGFPFTIKRPPIEPEKYWIAHSRTYTPQTGLRISLSSNNSVDVYLLGVSELEFVNWSRAWVEEQFPDLEGPQRLMMMENITVLESVLQIHSEVILRNFTSTKNWSYEYFPPTVLNITAIVANPSSYRAEIEVETTSITALAPRERVLVPAQWLIPIGIVLAVPWLILSRKKKV